ncbi:MAG TPA: six-cysteine peptide SCIFF [Clostridiales bacterium]|nr:six-cysteine peptide SCIFF [Clostridiales bacterium]
MKQINIIAKNTFDKNHKIGCNECQASCQSACKTSCTVGNQSCVFQDVAVNKKESDRA